MKPSRTRGPLGLAAILVSLCLPAPFVAAQDPGSDCDRLAGAPTDINRNGPGVSDESLQADLAIPACEQAVRLHPAVARFSVQLARALRKAAELGDARAQSRLGHLYEVGLGVAQDHAVARELYQKAAAQGHVVAQTNLATLVARGQGGAQDLAQAARWYGQAADRGYGVAMAHLAALYRFGDGVQQDLVKAYVWYRLAIEAGHLDAQLALGDLRSRPIRTTQEFSVAKSKAATEAIQRAFSRKSEEPAFPFLMTEEERAAFKRLRERQNQAPPGTLLDAEERMAQVETYANASAIGRDPFLSRHAELAKVAILTPKGQAQFEAAKWMTAAWLRGSVDAALVLAKMHLTEDSPTGQAGLWGPNVPLGRGETFVGSAAEAARWYRQAIGKGSFAARINLAALHEIGHGVARDQAIAREHYRQAVGTRFEGPAKIGLLRLELAKEWQAETERTDRVAASFKPELTDDPAALVVVAKEAVTSALVIDKEGRRVFSDSLAQGQEFRVPAGRDDLLLSVGPRDADKLLLRFKSWSYDLPKGKDAILARLDRNALARDNRVAVAPDAGNEKSVWRLPAETTRASRISVESIAISSVYIHSEDDVLGFQDPNFHAGRRIAVPNVAGLVLDIRGPELDRSKDAAVALTVDGTRPLKLTVPASCLARIELDATALRAARLAIGAPAPCDSLSEGESRDFLVSGSRVVGRLIRLPDEKVPGGITTFTMSTLQLYGRWDELYGVARIAHARTLRERGPNSFETISNELEIATAEVRLGKAEQARARLDASLDRLNDLGSAPAATAIAIYQQFGSALAVLGRYAEAERFFLYARALRNRDNRSQRRPQAWGMTVALSELFETSARTGQLDRAIVYLLTQFLFDKLKNPERSEKFNTEQPPELMIRLVDLLRRTDRPKQAASVLAYIHDQPRRDIAPEVPEPFRIPLDLTVFEQTVGPLDRSELVTEALGYLAQVYVWSGRPAEAVPFLEQLARTRRNIYGEANPRLSEALARLSQAQRALGDRPAALATARQAVSAAQQFFTHRFSSKQAAIARADALRPAVMALLAALHESGDPRNGDAHAQEAFEAAQHLQSSMAALALQAFGSRLSQSEPALRAFVRRRQDLEQQLTQLDVTLVSAIASRRGTDDSAERATKARIADVERQFRQLNAERPARLAEIDDVARARSVAFAEVRALLAADEALIDIVPGDDRTYVFAATRTSLQWIEAPLGSHALERMVATLRCGIDRAQWAGREGLARCTGLAGDPGQANVLPFNAAMAHELYAALLAPFETLIADKHLLMSLSGPLATLPPHLLVTARPETATPRSGEDYARTPWLGRRHAVAILPSIAAWASLRRPRSDQDGPPTRAPRSYLGLGNPELAGDSTCEQVTLPRTCGELVQTARLAQRGARDKAAIDLSRRYVRGGIANVGALREICPLPETALELACVAESLGQTDASVIVGAALSESAVKRLPLDQYRIIHFATHGLLADESRSVAGLDAEPALVLSPPAVATADDDGLLTASEIARLKLNADWIVLSACNTAAGDQAGSEALSGLARAFFYAGARTLLASHWAVNSGTAVLLTTHTFSALAASSDLGPAEALRRSMTGLMDDPAFAHPEMWAPFVVIGEGSRQRR